jgi:P2 family phage contractile tail tube protein
MSAPLNNALRNFSVYNGSTGNKEIGLAHITVPDIENLSEVLKGSGISGEPDVPILGHIKNMTAQFSFFTLTSDAITLYQQSNLILNCRATLQSYDASTGAFGVVPERLIINGFPRKLNLGRWEVASKGDMVVVDINVHYLAAYLNGIKVLEIDPFNSIHVVNGFDYLAADRSLL